LKFIISDIDFNFEQSAPSLDRQLRQVKQIIHSQKDFEYKYNKIFRKLSEIISFDNIHLFEHKDNVEEGAFSQKYMWDTKVGRLVSNLEDTSHVPYSPYFDRWRTLLSTGTIIQNANSNMPNYEQEYLNEHGAKFVVVLPVFFNYKYTGFVQINFSQVHRLFSENELNILQDLFESLYWAEMIETRVRELHSVVEITRQAHERKDNTLSNITHELQTPMNGIIGLTEQLDMLENDMTKKNYLESIKLSLSNLMTVVNNILDTSGDATKKYDFAEVPFTFRESIKNILEIYKDNAIDKGLEFNYRYDEDFPVKVIGDVKRISQILSNLLDNAVKFTHEGAVNVHFRAKMNDGKQNIIIEVADTGIGIEAENHELIFDKFVQLDSSDNRTYGGIGAGLTIVKDLVTALKGNIKVKSDLGDGSVFIVTIPTKAVEKRLPELSDHTAALRNLKFLVVDDNQINIKVVTAILKKWGSSFDTAMNGLEAIEKATVNDYDIIFMDIQMPVMDGFEATRQIRKIRGLKPRILALTASILRENEYKCIQAGMDGVIRKPFFPDNLITWIINKNNTLTHQSSEPVQEAEKVAEEYTFKTINMQYLEDIASGNVEFMQEMIDLFFDQVPEKQAEMEKAFAERNMDQIGATAHKLKPIVGYVGLDPAEIGLKDIEHEANRNGNFESIKKNYENVCKYLNLATDELKIYSKKL
jgi:signal transduction histidine kinase/AmiR/NasT family two-component response regulator